MTLPIVVSLLAPLAFTGGEMPTAFSPQANLEANRNTNRTEQREANYQSKDFSPLFALQVQGKSALLAKVGCQCSQCTGSQVV
jgi:hypothetical protein